MNIQKLVSYLVENPSALKQVAHGNASLLHVDQVTASIIVEGFQKEDTIRSKKWRDAG
ncbi:MULTISPECIES: competence pheromone ComX [Bacillus]|uniref:ComX pheromone n=1 Tax=Bacillus safensis TaxID=561879 RepID=A0A1L6ZG23_BACIA|nr:MULTISPECIES: competence pheromone ComX [Bacillus]APT45469.1 competence protein [Bacillus safensis]KRE19252.1 competence protein [Bacillus sp. Root920]MBL4985043.1 competence pheromone ComX [Bacillus safensis]MBW0257540.1 competence protein [Bacillus sp. F2HM]MEC1411075.1 competence pheromone ComX [Bacillus safensis]